MSATLEVVKIKAEKYSLGLELDLDLWPVCNVGAGFISATA